MASVDTLVRMTAHSESTPIRQLIAEVVRETALARVWDVSELSREAGVGRSTTHRVLRGEPSVSQLSLRQLERALMLPDGLLKLIDTERVDAVAAIPADNWPTQHLRQMVLTEMGWGGPATDRRRSRKQA